MARTAGISIENNFTKGLISEQTGVNAAENSVLESIDVVYDRKGRATSRNAFRNEVGAVQTNVTTGVASGPVRNEFVWDTVSGVGAKSFVVVQIGFRIYFYESTTSGSLSSGYRSFFVSLPTFKVASFSNVQIATNAASFSFGKGYLFVAHPMCDPFYVKYNSGSNTITANRINVQIRDLEGVLDNLAIDRRPTSLTNAHKYNLYNQGWYATVATQTDTVGNALTYWDSQRSDYPSNVDVWWYYLRVSENTGAEILSGVDKAADQRYGLYGNTPAPKGHYIIDAFQTNRSDLSGISGVVETSSGGYRPSVIAFYAGRVFYAGVSADAYASTVYFSQIVERDEQLGQCYQSSDPTSREIFDLVDSDGGTVKINDIAKIIDMRIVGNSLIIFASNGVWSISGTDNGPFKATDYTVSKITSFPAISRSSIVDVGGSPLWWNYEGIFSLASSQAGLTTDVTSLSDTTIKTFYTDQIPQTSKLYAKGAFNDQEGLVYWLYQNQASGSQYNYDRILVLDVVTGAFYPLSVPQGDFLISGVVPVRGISEGFIQDPVVTALGDPVVTLTNDPVYVLVNSGYQADRKIFKFLKYTGNNLTFAELTGTNSLDFSTSAYIPEFITGHRVRGELLKNFQTNYLTVLTEERANGSCYIQGVWDYTNSPNSGRYTNPQQVYRSRQFRDYQQSKIKIRGNGRSVRFKYFGEAGKPFCIIGWAGFETANTVP